MAYFTDTSHLPRIMVSSATSRTSPTPPLPTREQTLNCCLSVRPQWCRHLLEVKVAEPCRPVNSRCRVHCPRQRFVRVTWLCRMIACYHRPYTLNPKILYGDNQSAITTTNAPIDAVASSRTKRINIRFHIIREEIANDGLKLYHLRTDDMAAGCMTKALPKYCFQKLQSAMGVLPLPRHSP